MSESAILARVRVALSAAGVTIWRNNAGAYKDAKGHFIRYGVAAPGGSDLIGLRKVLVTPEMVGSYVAQFVAVEVKTATGRATPEQTTFLQHVLAQGGVAMLVRSEQEAVESLSSASGSRRP